MWMLLAFLAGVLWLLRWLFSKLMPSQPKSFLSSPAGSSVLAELPQIHAATTVELSISCKNLPKLDTFSNSDPFCVVSLLQPDDSTWHRLGHTEVLWNQPNPVFEQKFLVDFMFEERQILRFDVFDADSDRIDRPEDHDKIGRFECSLGELVSNGAITNKLSTSGTITVQAEELLACRSSLTLGHIKGIHFNGKCFFELHKSTETGYSVAYRSEVASSATNPVWKSVTLPCRALCNGDVTRPFKFVCLQYHWNGNHKEIGQFETTVKEISELYSTTDDQPFRLYPPGAGPSATCTGVILLKSCTLQTMPTFLDYLSGGLKISCAVSIDFTQSNGEPNDPGSLHYLFGQEPNDYSVALMAVMDVLRDYSENFFDVFGFGARIPPAGVVSHHFPMGPGGFSRCSGVDGVLAAYSTGLETVRLYGPTNFEPSVRWAAEKARSGPMDGTHYQILVIITDGQITDMGRTKSAIIDAAMLPLSIIIIGVGNDDFRSMCELDGDDVRISHAGRTAQRDIVQFVPFADVYGKVTRHGTRRRTDLIKLQLAKEVLAEVPEQVVSWMKSQSIQPRPPVQLEPNSLYPDVTHPTAPMPPPYPIH